METPFPRSAAERREVMDRLFTIMGERHRVIAAAEHPHLEV